MVYLASAFSPMMLTPCTQANVREITLAATKRIANDGFTSVVGHEITAKVIEALLECPVAFNRANITLLAGDSVLTIIPSFRANEAREFTKEEVMSEAFRCFVVEVTDDLS